jgi:hypothetical protein
MQAILANIDHYSKTPRIGKVSLKSLLHAGKARKLLVQCVLTSAGFFLQS